MSDFLQDVLDMWQEDYQFKSQPFPMGQSGEDDDVPYSDTTDEPYVTYQDLDNEPMKYSGRLEQGPGEVPTTQPAPPPPAPGAGQQPGMVDPAAAGMAPPGAAPMDPAMAGGMDPSMMGGMMPPMPSEHPYDAPSSPAEVGRIYELKKIHSRLVSIQSYLSMTTDVQLIKLRNYVSQALDLFRTLISNVDLYKEKVDAIVIMFYKFVDEIYAILSKYYRDTTSGRDVRAVE